MVLTFLMFPFKKIAKIFEGELFFAFFLSFGILFLLYPRLFLGLDSVMGEGSWALQDPAVSLLYFVPSGRMLRHELFTNDFNFLWTNARGYGQPILGNDIQTAPLFPLTLLLRPLPDPYFWQIFALLRMVLIGIFSYLFARQILNRHRSGALVFMLCFGFAVHVLRWANHAWQTGFLSTVMYLYFSAKFIQERPASRLRIGLGIIFSAYCVVTSGFPEASILGAFLSVFVLIPLLVAYRKDFKTNLQTLGSLIAFNATAFLLASPQILGIYDLIRNSADNISFRTGPGINQFTDSGLFWKLISRVTDGPSTSETIHFFNLIPLFLFGAGVVRAFQKKEIRWPFYASLLCVGFFVLKNFPIWPAFSRFVGNLPLFSTVWFMIYFLPLILFPFALLASSGADWLLENKQNPLMKKSLFLVLTVVAVLLLYRNFEAEKNASVLRSTRLLVLFLVFSGTFFASLSFCKEKKAFIPAFLLVTFLVLEMSSVRPVFFMKFSEERYAEQFADEAPRELKDLLIANGLNPIEMRDRSLGGTHSEAGVTSLNNGSAPIIPPRASKFILTLFKTYEGWGAQMPATDEKFKGAYRLVSNNLQITTDEDPNYKMADDRKWVFLGKAGRLKVFHDPLALPRAYLAKSCRGVETLEAALKEISRPGFQMGSAILEDLSPSEKAFCESLKAKEIKRVPLQQDKGTFVKLTPFEGPGLLVLNDLFYADWIARDEATGDIFPIKAANGNFRGVFLNEKRTYHLKFEYHPAWLPMAKTLFIAGIVFLFLILVTGIALRKKAALLA